jgi:hypothetical protein
VRGRWDQSSRFSALRRLTNNRRLPSPRTTHLQRRGIACLVNTLHRGRFFVWLLGHSAGLTLPGSERGKKKISSPMSRRCVTRPVVTLSHSEGECKPSITEQASLHIMINEVESCKRKKIGNANGQYHHCRNSILTHLHVVQTLSPASLSEVVHVSVQCCLLDRMHWSIGQLGKLELESLRCAYFVVASRP